MSAPRDFELIWNSLPNPVLTVDGSGTIVEVNSAAEDFLSASRRQLSGQKLAALAGEDSRLADLVRPALADPRPLRSQAGGRLCPPSCSGCPQGAV